CSDIEPQIETDGRRYDGEYAVVEYGFPAPFLLSAKKIHGNRYVDQYESCNCSEADELGAAQNVVGKEQGDKADGSHDCQIVYRHAFLAHVTEHLLRQYVITPHVVHYTDDSGLSRQSACHA